MLKLNTNYLNNFISNEEIESYQPFVNVADDLLRNKKGLGNDFVGWVNLPTDYDKVEFDRIKTASKKIQNDSDILLVIGIGGSYLGARAVMESLNNQFYNLQTKEQRNNPQIFFVGNSISGSYIKQLTEFIEGKDFSINIISKSGTTTEPAIAFRHFKNILVDKYGVEEANSRIYATTDKEKGALKEQAKENNWESFIVPDDVGGRFSVLTAVGLLPIACSGISIDKLMSGARKAQEELTSTSIADNISYKYAVIRNAFLKKGYSVEMLIGYEPSLLYFNEWWKQLFGESEGKNNTGLLPTSALFSTDLHSLGQYIQEGQRNIFETVINIKNSSEDITIQKEDNDGDGLNYLAGKNVSFVNQKAFEATAIAHVSGGVPNIVLELEQMTEESLGYLMYFFELSCGISGYLLGVNPFNQPGVEEYKKNMFALLGKPGFEELKEKLEKK